MLNKFLPAVLMASAVTAQLTRNYAEDIEESEFEGDLVLDKDVELEIDMILTTIGVRGARNKNFEKRINKQRRKKGKQILRLLKYATPERNSRDWLEYGCFCFSDIKNDIITSGIGRPIDPLDSACHALQECLKCINIDFEQTKKCHPYNGYKFTSAPSDGYNDMICRDSEGSCQRSTCECDREFIKKVQFVEFIPSYSKLQGFDRETECPMRYRADERADGGKIKARRMGAETEPDQCCGQAGKRRSFVSGSTKQCCATKTYNPFMIDCCDDGSLSAFGQC